MPAVNQIPVPPNPEIWALVQWSHSGIGQGGTSRSPTDTHEPSNRRSLRTGRRGRGSEWLRPFAPPLCAQNRRPIGSHVKIVCVRVCACVCARACACVRACARSTEVKGQRCVRVRVSARACVRVCAAQRLVRVGCGACACVRVRARARACVRAQVWPLAPTCARRAEVSADMSMPAGGCRKPELASGVISAHYVTERTGF